jgi:aminopeptidase-like protein
MNPITPETIYAWACDIFPFPRSLTGPGVIATLDYLRGIIPDLAVVTVPSGTRAFDWTVPDEWTIRGAYLEHESGRRYVDFADHNLHVLGYSEPVDQWLTFDELQPHLYSLPQMPDAIPYVTSYYSRKWGFALRDDVRGTMPPGRYHAVIDSTLAPGSLRYGEYVLKGRESREILFSTYICHPSMGNNECSGIAVTAALAATLASRADRRYTYRFLFLPETIGSIVYLSRHLEHLQAQVDAGFVVTCVGDARTVSFLPSRKGTTLADRVARAVLDARAPGYHAYSFLDRGSDERQFCSPLVDLPVVSVMRSKYGAYPEYHTSRDDLSVISPEGLGGSYDLLLRCIDVLEANRTYRAVWPCEPQLGKRGLYPAVSTLGTRQLVGKMLDVLAYADGRTDCIDIARVIGAQVHEVIAIAARLAEEDLLVEM